MDRRTFLHSTATVAALAVAGRAATGGAKPSRALKKGYMYGAGPKRDAKTGLSMKDNFLALKAAGFAGVEVNSAMDQQEVLAARDAAGLQIPSVVISTHWTHPITSPNPTMRETGLNGLLHGLRDAKAYGASSVLFVPGVVNKDISYADAHARAFAEIKKAVPLAEELGVAIAIENVWNKFLLSPLEAAAFVDSFKSPAVKWHFDAGNVVDMGWPDQWIRILGPRIAKIHVKEYSRKIRDEKGPYAGFRTELFTGDTDWPAVMAAVDAIGYTGWLISEQYRTPGLPDADWYAKLSSQMDQIIAS
ncbi:MAG: sugar phosphate isomerase/epimerase [Verrucomicrobia bacterium]|jgi:hexulose-6-phosphate isomerase|nr:sugar phosphate isomerase/epimerase [Verrucomicrobiota bacterium]